MYISYLLWLLKIFSSVNVEIYFVSTCFSAVIFEYGWFVIETCLFNWVLHSNLSLNTVDWTVWSIFNIQLKTLCDLTCWYIDLLIFGIIVPV